MKCEKCGAEIPEEAKKCPECGFSASESGDEDTKKVNAAEPQNGNEETDSDFEKRYSSMFENGFDDKDEYKVDEELKRRREARYDENFSNMTNEEKIQALEAARLARKEKREKKQSKKGSILPVKKSEGESETSKTVKMDLSEIKSKLKPEKKKSESREKKHREFSFKPKAGIIVGCIIAVLVVGIVIASVNMASKAVYEEPETPTVYTKGGVLCSYYNGKEVEISQSFIAKEYEEPAAPSATPGRSDDDEDEAEPTAAPEQIKEKDLINVSSAGDMSYFIDNADMNLNSGSLNYIKNGKKRTLSHIDDNVYYKTAVSGDGLGVLYLKNADAYGAGGTLCYWSADNGKSVKVSDNVNADNFMFAADGNGIVYVSNYNPEYFVGDLYLSSIVKGEVGESRKIESDVYKAFGTNPAGKTVVYAKNYNSESYCFDVYMMKDNASEAVMITDGSRCEPILSKLSNSIYVGGSYADYYQTLYYASLESGQKEKIASGLTELIEMSRDESAVVFRKANAEGTAFDYFYAGRDSSEAQELAMNITVLDDPDHKRVCQFDINDDFTKAVYIQGYDTAAECGQLYSVSINNGAVASDKKISDTAYSCNLTPDGNTIRFADGYDVTWNLVTLNAYTDENNTVLANEVGAGAFTFDKAGEHIVYAKNYSLESKTGDVYCVSTKGKTVEVAKGVSTYGLKNDGGIVYSADNDKGHGLYLTKPNGKSAKSIDKDVTKVIAY